MFSVVPSSTQRSWPGCAKLGGGGGGRGGEQVRLRVEGFGFLGFRV